MGLLFGVHCGVMNFFIERESSLLYLSFRVGRPEVRSDFAVSEFSILLVGRYAVKKLGSVGSLIERLLFRLSLLLRGSDRLLGLG